MINKRCEKAALIHSLFITIIGLVLGNVIDASTLENRYLTVDGGNFNYSNNTATAGSGNVGILVPTPSFKLHVSGNAQIDGPISTLPVNVNSAGTNINWQLSNKVILAVGASNRTLTFTDPVGSTVLTLIIQYTGSGNITWPSSVLWPEGVAPALTRTNTATDIVYFYYDDGNYYGSTIFNL